MKLEVGKKYVCVDGNVWHVFAIHPTTNDYLASQVGEVYIHGFNESGNSTYEPDFNLYLVKEYTPPRPDVEVLGDLIERVRYSQTCLPQETLDLLQEAEEMKKRMEK